jgi:hypothetical protein
MYSTCLFCGASLGANEAVERCPVGRRIAFDGARGRLWIVCRRCERWSLVPLDERWEAIEECERLFRATHLRYSTDNIGLARLPDGTDLVRIGEALRPELAAWRYGDQFGRRRRRAIVAGAAWGAAGVAVVAGSVASGIGVLVASQLPTAARHARELWRQMRVTTRLTLDDGQRIILRGHHLGRAELLGGDDGRWLLRVIHDEGEAQLAGAPALRAAATILPRLNAAGASGRQLAEALDFLERSGDAAGCFARAAGWMPSTRDIQFGERSSGRHSTYGVLDRLPPTLRLALEMAAHEETERLALAGELGALERAWREAEEVAAIADDLFLPPSVGVALGRLRGAP